MTDDVSNNENILMNDESTLLAQTTSNLDHSRNVPAVSPHGYRTKTIG